MNSLPYTNADFCHRGKQWGLCTTIGAHLVLAAVMFTGLPTFTSMVLPSPATVEQSVVSLRVLPAPQKTLAARPKAETSPPPPAQASDPTPVPTVQRRPNKQPSPPMPAKAKTLHRMPKPAAQNTPAASPPSTPSINEAPGHIHNEGQNADQSVAQSAAQARQTTLSYFMALLERNKHYPRAARKLGLEGLINVVLRIDAQGNIVMLNIGTTTAHPILRKAMDESLHKIRSQWQAQQARQGGHGGEALSLIVPVRFSLQDGG